MSTKTAPPSTENCGACDSGSPSLASERNSHIDDSQGDLPSVSQLHAGTSVVTIPPSLGTGMSGFFTERRAERVADDLTARCLVLDDGEMRLALVACDLIGITAATAAARDRAADLSGIPPEQAMISCTHTHTGPVPQDTGEEVADPGYLAWLAQRIGDGVAIAASRPQPARLAV